MLRALLVALALVVAAASARGEVAAPGPLTRGFDAVPNKPAATLDRFLTLDGASARAAGSFDAGLLFDFTAPTLTLKLGDDQYLGSLIPWRVDGQLWGAYAVHRRFQIGAALPVTLRQGEKFDSLRELGFQQAPVAQTALSDLRLVPKGVILDPLEMPLGLAAAVEVRVPTGNQDAFTGDRGVVVSPKLMAEKTFGPARVAANLGYRARPSPGQYFNLFVGNEVTFGAGTLVELPAPASITNLKLLAELVGATPTSAPFTFAKSEVLKSPLEGFLGLRSRLAGRWAAELAVGTGFTGFTGAGYGRELVRVIGGVRYEFEAADKDSDGVPDGEDLCPEVPEDRDGFEDADGCPEPDNDADGIPDLEDQCPNEKGEKEYAGCGDKDDDEIPDNIDKCPNDFGPAENDGCPEDHPPYVIVEANRLRLKANIRFDSGKASIKKESFPVLNEVSDVMKAHPEIEKVRVDGHTDNVGGRQLNLDLSGRRARSVVEYLVKKGIEPSRLSSKGFGFDKPIASNDTPLGRAKNRRVEFTILKGTGDVETGEKKAGPPAAPPPAPP